jgi:hypothetical protein
MPCHGPDTTGEDMKHLRDRVDELTRLLCAQCNRLEDLEEKSGWSPNLFTEDVRVWWQQHKKQDEERNRIEELQKEARREKLREQIQDLQQELENMK